MMSLVRRLPSDRPGKALVPIFFMHRGNGNAQSVPIVFPSALNAVVPFGSLPPPLIV